MEQGKPTPDPASAGEAAPQGAADAAGPEGRIIEVLRTLYDPEIPVNIYDLGLIYSIEVKDDRSVEIQMTLTSPMCPVAESLPPQVEQTVAGLEEVNGATVKVTWDPPWNKDMMSEAAKLELGIE